MTEMTHAEYMRALATGGVPKASKKLDPPKADEKPKRRARKKKSDED